MEGHVFRTNKHFLYAEVSGSATQNILTGPLILLSESDFQTYAEHPDTTVPPTAQWKYLLGKQLQNLKPCYFWPSKTKCLLSAFN